MNWKSEQINELAKNQIWRESIKKEGANFHLNEEFRVNPRNRECTFARTCHRLTSSIFGFLLHTQSDRLMPF